MEQIQQNKELVIRYFNAISGVDKTRELLEQYTTDEELMAHIAFFEGSFPKYEMFADEITCEGNRVVVRARIKATHEREFSGILPTHHKIEFPFVISYELEKGKLFITGLLLIKWF